MNKERFHNQLALSLGYERIVKDKRIIIDVDDSDDPWVTLKFLDFPEVIRLRASGDANIALAAQLLGMQKEIKDIFDAVHQAFNEANKPF